jgi:bis(5'-nucleosidyl)-tetraphosphatase
MSKLIVSAGIVPVRFANDEPLFLLLRAFGSFYDFPKGRVEEGEESLDTAIRETLEEASIAKDELDFRWGTDSYTTKPFNGYQGKKVGQYFVAETTRKDIILPVNPELGKPEHDGFQWVTYKEGQQLTNYRIGGVLRWANRKVRA